MNTELSDEEIEEFLKQIPLNKFKTHMIIGKSGKYRMTPVDIKKCHLGHRISISHEGEKTCPTCERKQWDEQAKQQIKDLKCPVCCKAVELEDYEENFISFKCKPIFDNKGNYTDSTQPHPEFRVMVCEECFHISCQCYDDPADYHQDDRRY